MQGGLNGRPGVSNSCRWVVRVVVEVFDKFSGVVSRSPCGLEDEWDQVDAGCICRTFSFFAFGHMRPALEEKGVTMAVATLSASWRRNDIINSGLCPPVGFASGVT